MVLCRFHFKCYYRQIIPQPCVVVDLIRTFNRWESLFLQTKGVHEKKSTEDGKSERYTHFFNSRKEADTPALIASATDDVSQSELLIVENEMKKLTQVKKSASPMSQKRSKQRLEHMLWIMEPKLHLNVSIKFIQSILFLEHPSTIANSKLKRLRNCYKPPCCNGHWKCSGEVK